MVGAGDLAIESAGERGTEQLQQHPQARRRAARDLRADGGQREPQVRPRRAAPAAAALGVSTAEQLEKLHGLLPAGRASPRAEYEAKKAAAARQRERRCRGSSASSRRSPRRCWRGASRRSPAPGSASSPTSPHVGGTKDPDVAAIVELAPDLVVMCDEENRREDADALVAAGLAVHVALAPRRSTTSRRRSRPLAAAVGAPPPAASPLPGRRSRSGAAAFVPIWRRPWMTLNARHLRLVGARRRSASSNVFADDADALPGGRPRRRAAPRARRRARADRAVPVHARAHLAELASRFGARAVLVDGQDLFWWGVRTAGGRVRLALPPRSLELAELTDAGRRPAPRPASRRSASAASGIGRARRRSRRSRRRSAGRRARPAVATSRSTSASSAGVDTSKSSRRLAWLSAISAPSGGEVAGAQRRPRSAHPLRSR